MGTILFIHFFLMLELPLDPIFYIMVSYAIFIFSNSCHV